jgi:hypothetical protein
MRSLPAIASFHKALGHGRVAACDPVLAQDKKQASLDSLVAVQKSKKSCGGYNGFHVSYMLIVFRPCLAQLVNQLLINFKLWPGQTLGFCAASPGSAYPPPSQNARR